MNNLDDPVYSRPNYHVSSKAITKEDMCMAHMTTWGPLDRTWFDHPSKQAKISLNTCRWIWLAPTLLDSLNTEVLSLSALFFFNILSICIPIFNYKRGDYLSEWNLLFHILCITYILSILFLEGIREPIFSLLFYGLVYPPIMHFPISLSSGLQIILDPRSF